MKKQYKVNIKNINIDEECIYNYKFNDTEIYVKPILKTSKNTVQNTNFSNNKLDSKYHKNSKNIKFGSEFDNFTPVQKYKQKIENSKYIDELMRENLSIESSEPSLIDIDERNDSDKIEVCPGHLIVETQNCMNINAIEHEGSLYIYENYAFSSTTSAILYTILTIIALLIGSSIAGLYFDSESYLALIGLLSGFAVLIVGWLITMYIYKSYQPNPLEDYNYKLTNECGVDAELQYYRYGSSVKIYFNGVKNIGTMMLSNKMFSKHYLLVKDSGIFTEKLSTEDSGSQVTICEHNMVEKFTSKQLYSEIVKNHSLEIKMPNLMSTFKADENEEEKEYIVIETYLGEFIAISEYRKTLKDPIYSKIKAYIEKWKSLAYEFKNNV
eukprot:Mrub_04324.p1 GENE.Mrub_04324~~Mrub_04324.p1  ORF type:complete len:406 (-),score=48.62 Mrub_04324:75-1223(-)